jgi:streptogramin lyase
MFPAPGGLSGPLTAGPDGAIWYVASNQVARVTLVGFASQFRVGASNTVLQDIASGPDGNLWLTDSGQAAIARVTPSGASTEFPVPGGGVPETITPGPDGNLWFTESVASALGRITPSGQFSNFPIPNAATGITAGPDGNVWFTSFGGASAVYRVTPRGTVTTFPRPGSPVLESIATGPDGNLWFTEALFPGPNKIARMTPGGSVTEFTMPQNVSPQLIVSGPDGNLWFTEMNAGAVGRITPTGTVTQFLLPVCGVPADGVAAGPSGTMWFTSTYLNQVGWFSVAGAPGSCRPYVPHCTGKAKRRGATRVSFRFTCSDTVPTFTITANRPVRAVSDAPSSVFGCSRAGPRSGRCTGIHEEQVSFGEGHLVVNNPCRPHNRRLALTVTAHLNSNLTTVNLRPLTFKLTGPC